MASAKMEPVSAHKDGMESTAHSKDALGGKKNDNFFNENMSNFVINFIQMFKSRTMSSWPRGIIRMSLFRWLRWGRLLLNS